MMFNAKKRKKIIAAFFTVLLSIQNFYPVAAYALTSGPSQPEMQKFQVAGASDLVDLFTGDFKYDIPVMDVGGYPLNLSYHSGVGIEDEASWVGAGWSLNPGSITRQMRGLPDDFTGDGSSTDPQDAVRTIQKQKDFKKIGGQLLLKPTALGWNLASASLHVDVHKDNYYGIGAAVGGGVSFNLVKTGNTSLTAGLTINSDNQAGVTVTPNFTLTANQQDYEETNSGSLSGSFAYNTRSGLENVNLGASFNHTGYGWDEFGNTTGEVRTGAGFASFDKFFKHSYTPTITTNTVHSDATFSLDLGPAIFGGYVGVGGSGYVTTQRNAEPSSVLPAYGYLHYSAAGKNPSALLDFNREKDGAFLTTQPAIPLPVPTPDYFVATSQAGMQQWHPVYNGNYVVYDRQYTDKNNSTKLGISAGFGSIFQAGAQVNITSGQTVTQEWTADHNNKFVHAVTTGAPPSGNGYEDVYFKQAGEQTLMSDDFYGSIGRDATLKVPISSHVAGGPAALDVVPLPSGGNLNVAPMRRNQRDIRTATFSYLTAKQASQYGLDKKINGTDRVDPVQGVADPDFNCHRKPHHLSEVTVTDKQGKRMVYGIPVYNLDQEEVSFSVATSANPSADRRTGLIPFIADGYDFGQGAPDNSVNNAKGRLNIYNRKSIPPYATSFLLTGILSPDYVDKTGDGITDDDLGTAIKFCYTKQPGTYQWRAPFEYKKANYNEGFLSDPQDDKGSYVFGKKEIWYLDSIRTATLVAVFYRSPRMDALGASDEDNSLHQDGSMSLQKLDKIALFSRADLLRNGPNAVPIKVVHFEYDYSLFPFVPNNSGQPDPSYPNNPGNNSNQGKLTLKRVYFTFGNSSRGQTNPYLFTYDSDQEIGTAGAWGASIYDEEKHDHYTQRQTDRWGTYRQSYFTTFSHVFNNSEFPYSLQPSLADPYDVRQLADRFASKWQLTSIQTPTGAIVTVGYEADDYSYVQDRNAMIMCPVVGTTKDGSTTLRDTRMIYVKVPTEVNNGADFVNTYMRGANGTPLKNIFYKMFIDVDNKGHNEYVHGYAEVDPNPDHYTVDTDPASGKKTIVGIPVVAGDGDRNPMSIAAWQLVQTSLPQYAYPNYDNSNVDNLSGDVVAALKAIIQDFANLRELFQSFNGMAYAKHYGERITPAKSLIRLDFPVGKAVGKDGNKLSYGKLGGGSRVAKVEIQDNWTTMNQMGTGQTTNAVTMTYGIAYDYTTTDDQNRIVSTGVASYEPEIGNEENPFREPIPFTEKVAWSNDKYHYIEKPFGESYFPSPSVGYSQVKATAYGIQSDEGVQHQNTGWTITQYYTARDFPTQVDYVPLEEDTYEYDLTLLLFGAKYTNRVTTSQGFKVTVNDMHGKLKSTQTYDMGGALIASTDYLYNVVDDNAQRKQLNNTVLAMDKIGNIAQTGTLIATDADVSTDVRESKTTSTGNSADADAGLLPAVFIPWPYAGFYYSVTSSLTSYNSISLVKVIHQYGLVKEVRTTQNGSTLTADNLLWDAVTGEVLLTRMQNEFNDYTYSLNYPAFRAYDGMGGAYQNVGAVLSGFHTDADGVLQNYTQFVAQGDELVDIDDGASTRGWILLSDDGDLRFIDKDGNFITNITGNYMVIRSGRRNLVTAGTGTVVTMTNPLILGPQGYSLKATVDMRVLDSKAIAYKDEWGVPVPNFMRPDQTLNYTYPLTIKDFSAVNSLSVSFPINFGCSNSDFMATASPAGTGVEITRSFLDLGALTSYQGYPITKIVLTLTPINLTGPNAAYIRRVNGPMHPCDDPITTAWFRQPPTTTSNQLVLAASAATAPIDYDLTAMYNEWIGQGANKDNPEFGVAIMLQDETTVGTRGMDFAGISPTSGTFPQVTVYYTLPGGCTDPVGNIINPYYAGVKGNWRPQFTYAYPVNRDHTPGNPAQNGGTNIRSNGYYTGYTPFWSPATPTSTSPATLQPIAPSADGLPGDVADARWVWATQSIYYDQKGNEVESKDALKRYSGVTFGYQRTLATAVASNARHNEIAYDGFEDYYFGLQTDPAPCPLPMRQLNFGLGAETAGEICGGGSCVVKGIAHTGNYSLALGGTLNIQPAMTNADPPNKFIDFDDAGHAILLANEQAYGFAPIRNGGTLAKDYVISFWVNDNQPDRKSLPNLHVMINGVDQQVEANPVASAVVEGWKLLSFTLKKGSPFSVQISTSAASVYLDDIRIFPFDANMKSYVYDDQSLRLMAQLDENNLATMYEYDREGTPIRVKRETEKGVMTIKENRQSLMNH